MRIVLTVLLSLWLTPLSANDSLPRRPVLGVPFSTVPPELVSKLNLQADEGLLAMSPTSGLSAEKAGLQAGDIILQLNGKAVNLKTITATVRNLVAGEAFTMSIIRDGSRSELKSILLEKPRDPGNANYEVIYSHVVSRGQKIRTIITKPRTPGKHPGFMFIQGFSPVSYDFTLEGSKGDVATIDGPILFEYANSGFVTIRVEKPGVGDSEGGPFANLDYLTELDIYRQALKQLKELEEVDAKNVFIFGHSMGGAFGPMIAAENPVKGLAVYGVAARTWYEYLLDTIRYQGLVAGDSFENTDEKVRQGAQLMALVFLENNSIDDIKKSHPQLTAMADALFPGGLFNGKTLDFWRQLARINFASEWANCDAHVLAVRGASDFVTYDVDHKLIADVVNKVHPGRGKSAVLANSDHLFHSFSTEQESLQNFQHGQFNPAFVGMMQEWIKEVQASE